MNDDTAGTIILIRRHLKGLLAGIDKILQSYAADLQQTTGSGTNYDKCQKLDTEESMKNLTDK